MSSLAFAGRTGIAPRVTAAEVAGAEGGKVGAMRESGGVDFEVAVLAASAGKGATSTAVGARVTAGRTGATAAFDAGAVAGDAAEREAIPGDTAP